MQEIDPPQSFFCPTESIHEYANMVVGLEPNAILVNESHDTQAIALRAIPVDKILSVELRKKIKLVQLALGIVALLIGLAWIFCYLFDFVPVMYAQIAVLIVAMGGGAIMLSQERRVHFQTATTTWVSIQITRHDMGMLSRWIDDNEIFLGGSE